MTMFSSCVSRVHLEHRLVLVCRNLFDPRPADRAPPSPWGVEMSGQSAVLEQLRFATSDFPVAERWPTFLDMGRTIAKVDCMPLEDDFFVDGFCKLPAAGSAALSRNEGESPARLSHSVSKIDLLRAVG